MLQRTVMVYMFDCLCIFSFLLFSSVLHTKFDFRFIFFGWARPRSVYSMLLALDKFPEAHKPFADFRKKLCFLLRDYDLVLSLKLNILDLILVKLF